MEIPKTLKDEIWDYCRLNNITNIDEFTLSLLTKGFTVEKYGATPEANVTIKTVEKLVTNDEEVKKLYKELEEIKAKNSELQKKLEQKSTNLYGES